MLLRPRGIRFELTNIRVQFRYAGLCKTFQPIHIGLKRFFHVIFGGSKKEGVQRKPDNASTKKEQTRDTSKGKGKKNTINMRKA